MATAYPIILALLNVDSTTYCYSTDDWVQTNTVPDRRFNPVLEDAPTIQQQLRDLYFGVEDSTSVDLDFLPITSPQDSNWAEITSKHDLRNGKIALWLIDGDADPAVGANYIFQYYGSIVAWTWKSNGGIHITVVGRNDAVFDTPLPSKLVNADDYPLALDIGMPVPMPFGNCKNVICPNICNDLANDYYDYAVAYSTANIEGLWEVAGERGVRRDGVLSTTTDYTFYNVDDVGNPYTNTAFIRFSLEQLQGSYLTITADVKGPLLPEATADRDFVDILEYIISDTTVGLGQSIDSTTFATAKTALSNIGSMYCDGVMQEQWQVRDYIDQLLRVMRGSLERGSDGEWELTIDQTGTSVQTFGDNDGLYNNCDFEYREPVNADSAIKTITLKYDLGMGGKTIEQSVRTGFGSPLDLELWCVADDDTATKVLSYEYQNSLLGDEEVGLTVEHYEGGDIDLGDVITLVGGDIDFVTNGDAELGATTGWTLYVDTGAGAAATLSVDSTVRLEGDYSFKIAATGGGVATTDLLFYQVLSNDFEIGEVYRIEVWAMADAASKTLRLATAKATTPYTNLSRTPTWKDVTMGTTFQRFVWEFRPSYNFTGDNRVYLAFGGQGAFNVWFDKISIRKVTYPNIGINEQTYRVINVSRNNVDQFNLVGRRYFEVLHDDIAVTPPAPETPASLVVKGPRVIHGATTLGDGENVSGTITLVIAPGQGDCYIATGKTDFTNVQTGFILGIDDSDSDTAKFYIGSSTQYLNWDGSALTVKGAITATSGSLASLTVTGSLTISTGGYIASGKTSYADTTAGYYLGLSGSTPVFHIGNVSEYMKWTGTNLIVNTTVLNTEYVDGSETPSGSNYDVKGDLKVFNGGDIYFYSDAGITSIAGLYNSAGTFQIAATAWIVISTNSAITMSTTSGNISITSTGGGNIDLTSGLSSYGLRIRPAVPEIYVNCTFRPSGTVTLGSSSYRWSTIYGTALNLAGAISGVTTITASSTITGANFYLSGTSGNFGVSGGARLYVATSQATLYSSSTHYVTNIGTTFRPSDQGSDGTGTDLGNPSYYWEQFYCYNLNEVADFFFLDHWKNPITGELELVDDVEIVKAIKGSGVFDLSSGLELIDDATLHPAIISKYGKDTFDIDVRTGEMSQIGTIGEVIQDPTGKPFLSHKTMVSLLMGCIRKLDERLAKLEN